MLITSCCFISVVKYQISVHTGDIDNAGTNANVYITIHGENGSTGLRLLKKSQNNESKFEQGQTDIFEIEAVWLKDLTKVIIGHDGKGFGAGWFMDKVVIKESADAEREFIFMCNRWLDEGEDDNLIERELLVTETTGEEENLEAGKYRFGKVL